MPRPAKRCHHCGAPLTVEGGEPQITCQYCGTTNELERPAAARTQPGPAKPGRGQIVLALAVAAAVAGVGAASALLRRSPVGSSSLGQSVAQALSSTQQFPLNCGMNQELLIADRKFEGSGTLITADINCKVRIKNSTLKADVILRASNLATIELENSTLIGKEAAVLLGMNSKLFARGKSTLRGEESAVQAGVNAELTLDDSTVEANEAAVRTEVNFKLHGNKSSIRGRECAVRAGSNFELTGRDLMVVGGRTAIEAEVNFKADLRGGSIEGSEHAIRTKGPNAHLKLTRAAKIKAKETALGTGSNLHLELDASSIEAAEVAIETDVNAEISLLNKARIHGGKLGVKAGLNLELDLRGSSIESQGIAVCAPFNIEISARDSTVSGSTDAFRFQRRPNELELVNTNVVGKQTFNGRGCSGQ